MSTIFISYRREDTAYVAEMIRSRFEEEFGKDSVFMDVDDIPLGRDFRAHITAAVARCDALLALIGDNWAGTDAAKGGRRIDDPEDFVFIEVQAALTRDIPVVPVLLGKAQLPSAAALPPALQALAYRNAIEIRSGPGLKSQLDLLCRRMRETLGSQPHAHPAHARWGSAAASPWTLPAVAALGAFIAFAIAMAVWQARSDPCKALPEDDRPLSCLAKET